MKLLKSKKFWLIVVVILAVLVAVWIIRSRNSKKFDYKAPPVAVVTFGEGGFTPQTVKVKAGTSVVFKNGGAEKFQVESNPHPTHTDLPGLDSKTAVSPSGTYSYTFTKSGTYHYHNELDPEENGTVVVE